MQRASNADLSGRIGFKGKWLPSFEAEQLKRISSAYPDLKIVYDFAEKRENIMGRVMCHNGQLDYPTRRQMREVSKRPGFQDLITRSGWRACELIWGTTAKSVAVQNVPQTQSVETLANVHRKKLRSDEE